MVKHKFDPKSPIIALFAKLSNSQTRRITVVLDTGATYTMIPWEIAEALGYEPAYSKRKIDITTASGVERAPLITISSVTVLGKEAKNVDCIVHDLPEVSRVDGLLGLSFLRNFELRLDFRKGILEID
jgi:clan AA aspartic protease (TIGR02281 family)